MQALVDRIDGVIDLALLEAAWTTNDLWIVDRGRFRHARGDGASGCPWATGGPASQGSGRGVESRRARRASVPRRSSARANDLRIGPRPIAAIGRSDRLTIAEPPGEIADGVVAAISAATIRGRRVAVRREGRDSESFEIRTRRTVPGRVRHRRTGPYPIRKLDVNSARSYNLTSLDQRPLGHSSLTCLGSA